MAMRWWYLWLIALGLSCRACDDVFNRELLDMIVRESRREELWKKCEWVRFVCPILRQVMIISARPEWLKKDFHRVRWSLIVLSLLFSLERDWRFQKIGTYFLQYCFRSWRDGWRRSMIFFLCIACFAT